MKTLRQGSYAGCVRESCYLGREITPSSKGADIYGGEKIIAEQVRGTWQVQADGEAKLSQAQFSQAQFSQAQFSQAQFSQAQLGETLGQAPPGETLGQTQLGKARHRAQIRYQAAVGQPEIEPARPGKIDRQAHEARGVDSR